MKIYLKKVLPLVRKTFFLYIILVLLGLNSYLDVSFASLTPSNQAYFESTPSFSLSIESTTLPVLWSRQIPAATPIPEPETTPTPLVPLSPVPYPTLIPTPSPTITPTPSPNPDLSKADLILFSILDEKEKNINFISWGDLVPGGEYNKTLFLINEGTDPLNVTLKVENWQPIKAQIVYDNFSVPEFIKSGLVGGSN